MTRLCIVISILSLLCFAARAEAQRSVALPERTLPVIDAVDLVVVGGGEGGLGAAYAAGKAGARVIVISDYTFLGDEYVAKAKRDLASGPAPQSEVAKRLFSKPDPADFSKAASALLREARVTFLDNSRYAGILVDAKGTLCGIATANKAGVQAIVAKAVLDVSQASRTADDAGAERAPWTAGTLRVSRPLADQKTKRLALVTKEVPMPELTWARLNKAEQALRETWNVVVGTNFAHSMDFHMPNALAMAQPLELENPRPEMFRVKGVGNLFVLGSSAAASPAAAERLMQPVRLTDLGSMLGTHLRAVAAKAAMPKPAELSFKALGGAVREGLAIRELAGRERPYRTAKAATVRQPAGAVPIWGEYEIVVVGGGPAGHAAAIAAGRAGRRVLLIEQAGFIGGNVALGITGFWRGYRRGFNQEWQKRRRLAYPEMLNEAGVDIWYHSLAVGAVMQGNAVRGVEVATWLGRGAALGQIVIDASGDGDVCVMAGAKADYINDGDLCIEEASFVGHYPNSMAFDPMDVAGATLHRVLVAEHVKKAAGIPIAQIRETRRILGDYQINELDVNTGRTYADVIGVISCAFDPHGYYMSDYTFAGLMISTKKVKQDVVMYVPLRACIPAGVEGLYVAGRCFSCTHDAQALARMNPDMLNQGYAVGYAAALCVQNKTPTRAVDIRALQKHLVAIDCLPAETFDEIARETPPVSEAEIEAAAQNPGQRKNLLTLALAGPRALPALRAAFATAPTPDKAKALCLLGDKEGVPLLAQQVKSLPTPPAEAYAWDGFLKVPELDGAAWCLAIPRDPRATEALTERLAACDAATGFNTLRSLTRALGRIGDPKAAPALAAFLKKPGVQGHCNPGTDNAGTQAAQFSKAMIELFAASALYACGDCEGLGRAILTRYLDDWRGIFVRYAGHALGLEDG
ncbi:MAG: soluble pyridine nucleotide transhydrogenase [Chloroflexi bacterium ADurb.Bin325]|nr:MAG: soluble pyridine nucleotide transhydrogenase [Chloroflexi bacterium ADurb.Bin325]